MKAMDTERIVVLNEKESVMMHDLSEELIAV